MPEQHQGHSSRRRVWTIAGPAILANSSAPLIGLVDTWAIGHLPSPVHLASVGLGSVIFNYLLWAFGFLRMGTTGLVAQAHGAGDAARLHAEILRASALALVFGFLLLGVQETLLYWSLKAMAPPAAVAEITSEYFRIRIWAAPASLLIYSLTGVLFGLGRTRAILMLQLVLNISNGILNLVFVIGLDLGVPGVALGTLIAQWLCAILSIRVIIAHTSLPQLLLTARDGGTWVLARLKRLMMINGFIFVRTIFLMTALAMVMRVAGQLGETEMAASHVINQYMLLMALGLDGFAHAAEALAGKAWGEGSRARFRHWVVHTGIWGAAAAVAYAILFLVAGNGITALLTDLPSVRELVAELMPFVIALPLVSIWCYHFDGVFIGATAAAAMMTTMGLAFTVYLALLGSLTDRWGLHGLWGAVLVFMALRGIAQAAWYPRLEKNVEAQA
ncbi:MAG: MATE family efflux transporter [Xanthomonadales bacterium]|nr:MATE family efflux transporter [Xanthomonadales bacterium]